MWREGQLLLAKAGTLSVEAVSGLVCGQVQHSESCQADVPGYESHHQGKESLGTPGSIVGQLIWIRLFARRKKGICFVTTGRQAGNTVGAPGNPRRSAKLICCSSETRPGALCYDSKW
jgi:hypothetical protein